MLLFLSRRALRLCERKYDRNEIFYGDKYHSRVYYRGGAPLLQSFVILKVSTLSLVLYILAYSGLDSILSWLTQDQVKPMLRPLL